MMRILTVWIIGLCGYASIVSAAEQPTMHAGAKGSALAGLRQSAFEHWKQGQFEKAADDYRDILRLSDGSQASAAFAEDLHSAAVIEGELGHYRDAKAYYRRELDVLHRTGNEVAAGEVYRSLAGILQIEGAFSEAETSYQKSVELLTRCAGPGDIRTATTLNGLAWLYTLWGKMHEANLLLRQAMEAADRALAPDDPRFIRFLDVRASFLTASGKYSEAERSWKRALQIGKKAYSGDDAKYDEVLLHLGQLYSVTEDFKSAEDMFQRFLVIAKPLAGPDSVIRAVATAELARVYSQQRKFDAAAQLFSHSIQLIETERDKVPVVYSLIRTYFGDYYMARSQWPEAEVQYRNALALRETMLGKNAPDVAASMLSLSKALTKLHRKKEAQQYYAQALAIATSQNNAIYSGDTIDVRAFRPH